MGETSAQARLVDSAAEVAAHAVTTTLMRAEIEEALAADEPPELHLDVIRRDGSDGERHHTVAVAWEREDLERLLKQSESDRVLVAFDAEALGDAFGGDVEGHGLRERAVVLAAFAGVAAAAAPAPAAAALAEGAAVTSDPVAITSPEAARVAPPPEITSPEAARVTPPAEATSPEAVRATQPPPAQAAPPVEATSPEAVRAAQPPPAQVTPPVEATSPEAVRATQPPPAPPATSTPGGGITVSLPEPGTAAAIAGGILIAIAGAAFVAGRRRTEAI